MKLLALATPLLALGLVLLLQRMEAWCGRVPRAAGDRRVRASVSRTAPPMRSTMPATSAPSSAATAEGEALEPLLRDPPSPPGYVDPLEGSPTLEDLMEDQARAERSTKAVPGTDADRPQTSDLH